MFSFASSLHRMQFSFALHSTSHVFSGLVQQPLHSTCRTFICLIRLGLCANAELRTSATDSTTLEDSTAPGIAQPLQWIPLQTSSLLLYNLRNTAWLTLYQAYRCAVALQIGPLFFWWHLHPQERFAWQCCSFYLRSDMRWYSKALPMWTLAQQRLLEHLEEETPETASFQSDHSMADSEIDVIYQTLPPVSQPCTACFLSTCPDPQFTAPQRCCYRGRQPRIM